MKKFIVLFALIMTCSVSHAQLFSKLAGKILTNRSQKTTEETYGDMSSTQTYDGVEYTVDSDCSCAKVKRCSKDIANVVIRNTVILGDNRGTPRTFKVMIIGAYAFYECSNLTNITIPNSVTEIGERAFAHCTNLSNITIPNSITEIGEYAFTDCPNLSNITIPNSVTEIGEYAFSDCPNLSNITIPNSVETIGNGTFSGCTNLNSVTIPNSVKTIGNRTFYRCI